MRGERSRGVGNRSAGAGLVSLGRHIFEGPLISLSGVARVCAGAGRGESAVTRSGDSRLQGTSWPAGGKWALSSALILGLKVWIPVPVLLPCDLAEPPALSGPQ